MEALVPYAGTNRIRSAGISQPMQAHQHPDKKVGSLLELTGSVKESALSLLARGMGGFYSQGIGAIFPGI